MHTAVLTPHAVIVYQPKLVRMNTKETIFVFHEEIGTNHCILTRDSGKLKKIRHVGHIEIMLSPNTLYCTWTHISLK